MDLTEEAVKIGRKKRLCHLAAWVYAGAVTLAFLLPMIVLP
jgi:hypothetical protein